MYSVFGPFAKRPRQRIANPSYPGSNPGGAFSPFDWSIRPITPKSNPIPASRHKSGTHVRPLALPSSVPVEEQKPDDQPE